MTESIADRLAAALSARIKKHGIVDTRDLAAVALRVVCDSLRSEAEADAGDVPVAGHSTPTTYTLTKGG